VAVAVRDSAVALAAIHRGGTLCGTSSGGSIPSPWVAEEMEKTTSRNLVQALAVDCFRLIESSLLLVRELVACISETAMGPNVIKLLALRAPSHS